MGGPLTSSISASRRAREQSVSTLLSEEMLRGGSGFFRARLTEPDDLAADNEARAAVAIGAQLRVLLVSASNPFLESALKASPNIALDILAPENWRDGMGAGFDAVIFDDWSPESLGAGNFFFFGRSPFQAAGSPNAPSAWSRPNC